MEAIYSDFEVTLHGLMSWNKRLYKELGWMALAKEENNNSHKVEAYTLSIKNLKKAIEGKMVDAKPLELSVNDKHELKLTLTKVNKLEKYWKTLHESIKSVERTKSVETIKPIENSKPPENNKENTTKPNELVKSATAPVLTGGAKRGSKKRASKKGSKRASKKGSKRASKKGSKRASKRASKKGSKRASKKGSKRASKKGSKRVSRKMSTAYHQ
jgi:hypothetical protein